VLQAALAKTAVPPGRHALFARAETVKQDDLIPEGTVFRVGEITLGCVYAMPVAYSAALGPRVNGALEILPSRHCGRPMALRNRSGSCRLYG